MTTLSIFDLDRTLTKLPTYSAFLLGAARADAPWRLAFLPLLLPVAIPYALKRVERRRMKEAMHAVMLGRRVPRARAEAAAERFADQLYRDGLYPQALARIAAERADGRRVMLATAAPAFYVAPLARRLGIDDVIATAATWDGDTLTHRIAGENCYGPAKLAMIESHLAAHGLVDAHIRFFSDHHTDLPVFDRADEPVAVNPTPKLRGIAQIRGWPVLDWRA